MRFHEAGPAMKTWSVTSTILVVAELPGGTLGIVAEGRAPLDERLQHLDEAAGRPRSACS